MKYLVLALPFLLASAPAWADDALPKAMSLDEERPQPGGERAPLGRVEQEQEPDLDPQRPQFERLTAMEYFYRWSELETGLLYTDFAGDLNLETDLGFYVRYGLGITEQLSVNLTYRHYDFDSSRTLGKPDEHILIRGLLLGLGYHQPLTSEFALVANLAAGIMRWETTAHQFQDDTGLVFSGEVAATAKLHEVLRFKAGVLADLAMTEFHEDSTDGMFSLSFLVGFEIGAW